VPQLPVGTGGSRATTPRVEAGVQVVAGVRHRYGICCVSRASAAVLLAGGRDLEVWGTAGRAAVQVD
jgi:hypothetical protein